MAAIFLQDPQATLDYVIDWSAWLNGDTIITSAWAVTSDLSTSNPTFTTTSTTVFVSGGTPGIRYKVRNHITTSQGRTEEETFDLVIRDH